MTLLDAPLLRPNEIERNEATEGNLHQDFDEVDHEASLNTAAVAQESENKIPGELPEGIASLDAARESRNNSRTHEESDPVGDIERHSRLTLLKTHIGNAGLQLVGDPDKYPRKHLEVGRTSRKTDPKTGRQRPHAAAERKARDEKRLLDDLGTINQGRPASPFLKPLDL